MKKHLIGAVAATAVLSPIAAMAKTGAFRHAFTGRLGELVAAQVGFNDQSDYGRANPQRNYSKR